MAATPENKHPIDAIVTLGLELNPDGSPKPELVQRVKTAVEIFTLLSAYQEAPLLIMSGKHSVSATTVPPWAESKVMVQQGIDMGVPEKMFEEEPDSLETWDNAIKTRVITERLGLRRLLLVTTGFHGVVATPAFSHTMGPSYEITGVASADPPWTPAQTSYVEAATQKLQAIVESTEPGDVAAIQTKLYELTPAFQALYGEQLASSQLQNTIRLERTRRRGPAILRAA